MKFIRKAGMLLCIFFCTTLLFAGCRERATEGIQMNGIYFDTIVTIKIWGAEDQSVLTQCEEICRHYEKLLSRTIDTSDISRINQAGGMPVEVDPETADLIKEALKYCEISEGYFDITIAPLSSLWNFGHNDGTVPDPEAVKEAQSHVDYRKVKVEGSTVQLLDPEAAIDLGAIAKGYIADRLKEYLEHEGITSALISLGGNTVAIGGREDGTPFKIGVQKPFAKQNETITSLEITGRSLVSSGTYERYFEKDGILYHHLLNPFTGYPSQNGLLQVTILSDSSAQGDALSTSCFALGLEKGAELIENTDNVTAFFVTEDYKLHQVG